MTYRRTNPVEALNRAVTAAEGWLELCRETARNGDDTTALRRAAIKELQRLSDDDEWVDAMYDLDQKEQQYLANDDEWYDLDRREQNG